MNRRRFLSFLGLAPIAAAVPAMALPRAEKPTGIDVTTDIQQPLIFSGGKFWINPANIGTVAAGALRSQDGKTVFDMGKDEIRIID